MPTEQEVFAHQRLHPRYTTPAPIPSVRIITFPDAVRLLEAKLDEKIRALKEAKVSALEMLADPSLNATDLLLQQKMVLCDLRGRLEMVQEMAHWLETLQTDEGAPT